jgi:hypothetical protein
VPADPPHPRQEGALELVAQPVLIAEPEPITEDETAVEPASMAVDGEATLYTDAEVLAGSGASACVVVKPSFDENGVTTARLAAEAADAKARAQVGVWTGRQPGCIIKDVEDEDETNQERARAGQEEAKDECKHEEMDPAWWDDAGADYWDKLKANIMHDADSGMCIYLISIHARTECMLRDAVHSLSEDNKRVVAAFFHKLKHHLTNNVFRKIPHAYPGARGTPLWKACQTRVGKISGLKPRLYGMCINSCLCYTSHHAGLEICPHCHEKRHDGKDRTCWRFSYIPLIPRLRALWESKDMAKIMEHRGKFTHNPEVIKHIFNGLLYRSLLGKHVQPVGSPTQRHWYFDRDTDMVLGLSTDGCAPFRQRAKTACPLLLFNYNLPPDV